MLHSWRSRLWSCCRASSALALRVFVGSRFVVGAPVRLPMNCVVRSPCFTPFLPVRLAVVVVQLLMTLLLLVFFLIPVRHRADARVMSITVPAGILFLAFVPAVVRVSRVYMGLVYLDTATYRRVGA